MEKEPIYSGKNPEVAGEIENKDQEFKELEKKEFKNVKVTVKGREGEWFANGSLENDRLLITREPLNEKSGEMTIESFWVDKDDVEEL